MPDPEAPTPSLRGATLRHVPLASFFHPRTVAVIGASATRRSPTRLLYKTVKKKVEGEGGTVYPVNPKYDEIDGVPCLHSIHDVPGELDLVVITAGDPVKRLADAVTRRPKFAMVFAAGFGEAGADGARAQAELRRLAREHGVFLLGPNTTLNSFLPLRDDLPGPAIALVSHSGHHGRHIWQGQEVGIPMAYWAPTGNEADLEFADFVRFYADQESVGAIAGYVEGFKDGRTTLLAADHAMRRAKPIVLVKVGRTALGRSLTRTHTAHDAGDDAVSEAVFRQYGISRVDSMDELLYASAMLARSAPPRAEGVVLYSLSGGALGHLADLAQAGGLPMPELDAATQAGLRELIPDYLRVSNPVDSGGGPSGDERGKTILELLVGDPNIGVVVCPFVANAHHLSDAITQHALEVAPTTDKPICIVWGSPSGDEATYQKLREQGDVPVFRTFGQCVAALRSYFHFHAARRRYVSPLIDPAPPAAARAIAGAVRPGTELDAAQTHALLAAYGIECSAAPSGAASAVSMHHDAVFGPTVRFGLSGVAREVFDDVAVRVAPYGRADAEQMVAELRSVSLLDDPGAVVDVLCAVGRLAHDLSDVIAELHLDLAGADVRSAAIRAAEARGGS